MKDFEPYMHADDRSAILPILATLRGATSTDLVADVRVGTEGAWRILRHRGRIVSRSADGAPRRIVGTVEDVTAVVANEHSLRKSQQLLEEAQSLAHIGAWEYDLRTGTVTWSAEVYRIFDVDASTKPTLPFQDAHWFPDADRNRIVAAFLTALRTSTPFDVEVPLTSEKSRERWARFVGQPEIVDEKLVRLYGHVMDVTERRKAEQAVRESENTYRDLLEQTPLGILRIDPSGAFVAANSAALQMLGMPSMAALRQRRGADFYVNPDDRAQAMKQVMEGEKPGVLLLKRPNGETFWVQSRVHTIHKAGQVAYFQAVLEDVTAHVLAQRETERAQNERIQVQNQLAAIVESSIDAILSVDEDGLVTTWNLSATVLLGWSATEVIGSSLRDLIVPNNASVDLAPLEAALRGQRMQFHSAQWRTKQGSDVHVRWSSHPVPAQANRVAGVAFTVHDLSLDHRAAAELAASRQSFQSIVENVSEGIIEEAVGGAPLYINPAGLRILGYDSVEQFRAEVSSLSCVYSDPRQRDTFIAHVARGEPGEFQAAWRKRDGGEIPVALLARLVPQPDGTMHWLKTVRDRTPDVQRAELVAAREKQAMQLESVQAANRFKADFMNMAAHEMSNPLTPLRLGVANLRQAAKRLQDSSLDQCVERMERNTMRLVAMVEDLLQVGRVEANAIEYHWATANLADVCRDAMNETAFLAENSDIQVTTSIPDVWLARVDRLRLGQAVTNLLSNAIKYSANGSRIGLDLSQDPENVRIAIKDQGRGIETKDLERMFQPFVRVGDTRAVRGTGLGLFITRAFVRAHGGTVAVTSEGLGKGSTFTMTLPKAMEPGGIQHG